MDIEEREAWRDTKDLSERDICTKYKTSATIHAGYFGQYYSGIIRPHIAPINSFTVLYPFQYRDTDARYVPPFQREVLRMRRTCSLPEPG